MPKPRKSAEDWIKAGFRALATNGPEAIRVEPIARSLGTTKGSFYWHFKDLDALRGAMITYWRAQATEVIITHLETLPQKERLTALFQIASHTPEDVGGPAVEIALRNWAQSYPPMRDALTQIDAQRLTFLEATLENQTYARLIYAAHLGQQALGLPPKTAAKDLQALSSSFQKYSTPKP